MLVPISRDRYKVWQRSAGAVLIALGLFAIDTNSIQLLDQIIWPTVITIGFYLITSAPLATALIVAALALVHTDSASQLLAPRILYPAIATLAASLCVVILTRRFRQRIANTHDARWSPRNGDQPSDKPDHEPDEPS